MGRIRACAPRPDGAEWTAENRAQDLSARWTAEGLLLKPRRGPGGATWIGLDAVSRGALRFAPARGAFRASPKGFGRRLVADRGPASEWWESRPEGLEHGFDLAQRPPGSGLLAVTLAVRGAKTSIVEAGAAALFTTADGRVWRYGALQAIDADGRALRAWMEPAPAGLRLVIDDSGARYPITVDPLLTSQSVDVNKAWGELGTSVAAAGDVNGDGRADVVASAPWHMTTAFGSDRGKVWAFYGTDTGMSPTASWSADSDQDKARFGQVVASAGDVNGDGYDDVLVGAPFRDAGGLYDAGRALLYLGSAAGLSSAAAWTVDGDQAGALFGAVASAGDVNNDGFDDVLVGAPNRNGGGSVFLYLGARAGLSRTPAWTATESQAGAGFGFSVAGAGDVNGDGYDDVVVGAYDYDASGLTDAGRVTVYLGTATGLQATPVLSVSGSQAGGILGNSVATAGDVNGDGRADVAFAGAMIDDGETDEGKVFVHLGTATGVRDLPSWTGQIDQASAWFGTQVASAGDVNGDGFGDLVAGAYLYDGALKDEGGAFLFYGSPTGLATKPAWTVAGGQLEAILGMSVAAGDVNGDHLDDVVVGMPWFESEEMQDKEGAVLLFLGCPDGNRDGTCGDASVDADGDGDPDAADCRPADPAVHHGASEMPDDGIDQDCSGADAVTCWRDADGDGFAGTAVVNAAGACGAGQSAARSDCDDANASVHLCADAGAPDAGSVDAAVLPPDATIAGPDASASASADAARASADAAALPRADAASLDAGVPVGGDETGCGCATTSPRSAAWWTLAAAGLLAARRRKRGAQFAPRQAGLRPFGQRSVRTDR